MKTRLFIERKDGLQIERNELIHDIEQNLNLTLPSLRYILIYDIFNISESLLKQAKTQIFSEPNRDNILDNIPKTTNLLAIEALPGQFDQRSDSAMQCLKILDPSSNVFVTSGFAIFFNENISAYDLKRLKKYLINDIESKEKDLTKLMQLSPSKPESVKSVKAFIKMATSQLETLHKRFSLVMTIEDLAFVQSYFQKEKRNPSITELKILDTYWSDHCRHTTFETMLDNLTFDESKLSTQIEDTFKEYLKTRHTLNRNHKPITLMDIATINAKLEYSQGNLDDLELSEEVNAVSIYIDVDAGGTTETWCLMFKNETHNHPTEIEPFGGASTCIGGAIRDPLSGRSYVYQAMRISGAGNILADIKDTIPGKLPQRIITKKAALGYASYGNQIGLPTTFVDEIYHDGYLAKHMEVGAVVGAVKKAHLIRQTPQPGDVVLVLGGKTGRDGIGGATGSSKKHTKTSLHQSQSEVQKGNAPEERKIQRLFRNEKVTKLIKKSNDFGAGGISVAIGELAVGIKINLDKLPTKYQGINGTELAISESQERMAVVLDKADVRSFKYYCNKENIEVSRVATVTKKERLVIQWKNTIICDLKRDFLDSAGVRQQQDVHVKTTDTSHIFKRNYHGTNLKQKTINLLLDPNAASKQGLIEMFDSSIGNTTVLSPFGGKYKLTKTQASVHKLPVKDKPTTTTSMMAYGFNPYISSVNPYIGSTYAIVESMAKIVATGGSHQQIRFTFQEYFEKLEKDPKKWGKPFMALLGAYNTLKAFNLPAVGGKDSMSGTYHELHVPPTLISFAVTTGKTTHTISPEFKSPNHYIYLFNVPRDENKLPLFEELKRNFTNIHKHILDHTIISAHALTYGGLMESLVKMSFGNKIGLNITTILPLFKLNYGSIVVESTHKLSLPNAIYLGKTTKKQLIQINTMKLPIDEAIKINQERYSSIFPLQHKATKNFTPKTKTESTCKPYPKKQTKITVLIPVFPGTNCEYDSKAAFNHPHVNTKILVFNNQTEAKINRSITELVEWINKSHILMLSGGFSSGDEPDGSGKFIASVLRNDQVKKAIHAFLSKKHLILGICNGFQALIKSGLLPHGKITDLTPTSPTLHKNKINRHASKFIRTSVSSTASPWLSSFNLHETHTVPISHTEGNFYIDDAHYQTLLKNNQIAFQYIDASNTPTMNPTYNPNGASYAIEGLISKDGLIIGKMAHSERKGKHLFKNISGNKNQDIFINGINYFLKETIHE
ncbi:MAG: phosphoribosylformylglycinamidine synthase [Candidatus Izimaplasma sp.]|nr:phosphoribosylformylglycinamidine synthase [Candidatus Izimaplasma bacterium]